MPRRKLQPLTFTPVGVSDTLDGTTAFPGAMLQLANLVHAPSSTGIFVPRPAAVLATSFPAFNTPGQGSLLMVIGTRAYGMIASQRYPGHDEPFIYDLVGQQNIPISNVTSANTPLTQPTTGDWTPPTGAQPAPNLTIFTHPGFAGAGTGMYFGWIDETSLTIATLKGNTTSGSPIISSIYDGGTSAPIIDGVTPGQSISGAGIPAGAYVVSAANGVFSLNTTGSTHANTTLDGLASTTGVAVGMSVVGPQFAAGTYVAAIVSGTAVTLSTAALGSATGTTVNFSGGGSITISASATATATLVSLTMAGGTPSAPRWSAGNTNVNPLLAVPVAVAGFNGRGWFAVNNTLRYTDPLLPLNITSASQGLTLDNTPITALSGDPLTSQVTGGVIQSLVAFKGAASPYLITGDVLTGNLVQNAVAGGVGTLSPNTICQTPLGLAYIAPDGLRILGPTGVVTETIGSYGKGVSVPFINAIYPTRMSASYSHGTIRIAVQNSQTTAAPWQEYFFNVKEESWTGPHTFAPILVDRFYNVNGTDGFVTMPQASPGTLCTHSIIPTANSVYTENGNPLSWAWQTSLLPDNGQMTMNQVGDTTLALTLPPGQAIMVSALDEGGNVLGYVNGRNPVTAAAPTWGSSTWGAFNWGTLPGFFKQWRIPWPNPIVFKQMSVLVTGASQGSTAIGNLYLGYQPRGYLVQEIQGLTSSPPAAFTLDSSLLGGPSVLG